MKQDASFVEDKFCKQQSNTYIARYYDSNTKFIIYFITLHESYLIVSRGGAII